MLAKRRRVVGALKAYIRPGRRYPPADWTTLVRHIGQAPRAIAAAVKLGREREYAAAKYTFAGEKYIAHKYYCSPD